MKTLEARRSDLVDQLKAVPPAVPRLHPNVATVYREKIAKLREALNAEGTRTEAAEMIRGLIEEIRLVPEKGSLRIELFGELAALSQPYKPAPPFQWNEGASNAGCGGPKPPRVSHLRCALSRKPMRTRLTAEPGGRNLQPSGYDLCCLPSFAIGLWPVRERESLLAR